MNPRTFDFHVTAIDRALLGLVEERARLVAELAPGTAREPDLDDLGRHSVGELTLDLLALVFGAVHRATTEGGPS